MCVRSRLRLGLVVVGAVLLTLSLVPTAAASGAGGGAHASPTADTDESSAVTVTKSLSAANGKTTLSGTVQYRGVDGNLRPARQVTVKIRHDVVGPVNPVIARTTTDDQGRYSVQIDVAEYEADVDFDKKLFLHVQAVAKNPAVNVVNFGQNLDTANGNTWTLNQEAMVKRGQNSATVDLTATKEKPRRAFQVANWTLEAYRFTEREAGWTRNRVKARYPAANPNNSQFKSPFEKFVIGSNGWDADKRHTVHHEYGHAVMSGLFKYKGWQIPKPANWGPHCVWSDTGRITAWYEGFAEFFEAAVNDSPRTDGMWLEQHHYYNETNEHGPQCPESHANDGYDGAKVEGAVANILWDVYDPANEPHDEIDGDLGTIFDAVNETDNQQRVARPFNSDRTTDIHDFFIQYVDNTGRHEELRKIYFEYGIVKPDRFDSATSASGPLSDCSIHYYPCSKQPKHDWTTLDPDTSVDVMLHGSDIDKYIFQLSKGDTIDVTTTAHGGGTTAAFEVFEGEPPWGSGQPSPAVASSTESGNVHSTTFTADRSGKYTVIVQPPEGSFEQVTSYTLSVTHASDSTDSGGTGDGGPILGPGDDGPRLDPGGNLTTDPCPTKPGGCDFDINVSGFGADGDESTGDDSDGTAGTDSSTDSGSGDTGASDSGSGDSATEGTASGSQSDSSTRSDGTTADDAAAVPATDGDSDGSGAVTDTTQSAGDGNAADDPGATRQATDSDGADDGITGSTLGVVLALLLALLAVLIAVLRR
ncbi:hypothetical protein [Halorientalis regularis]|uniref:Pre-peptidase C-terminal domain-containing protein n=1 Tax=Halorientalis regularis TaxID=660518 RepID=A0A1G7GXA2_9EURY|nr:hypothetical protein [Halorientalis regularis]SDE92704.1 hypothetical protein SAMN05216218_102222 [Halorientalis regularis]